MYNIRLDLETTNRAIDVIEKLGLSWRPSNSYTTDTTTESSPSSLALGLSTDDNHNNNNNNNNNSNKALPDITVAALSGISTKSEVDYFRSIGVSCCLIGETLV